MHLHHHHHHHEHVDYKEQETHPKTMIHGQGDENTIVNAWISEGVLRFQINNGIACRFPKLPGNIQRMGVERGTVYMIASLEHKELALYKIVVPSAGEEARVSFVRDIRSDEEYGEKGLWVRKCGSSSYAYQLSDNPERDGILIDSEEGVLGDAFPIAIHRFCVIYYKKTKCDHPKTWRLTSNIIMLEHNEEIACTASEWMFPSPAFSLDHSPLILILTVTGNLIFLDIDSLTAILFKKRYESAGIRAIFKGVNSSRRIVGIFGESIIIEADLIERPHGHHAHSSSYKIFKARLPQKFRGIQTRSEEGINTNVMTDPDPVKLIRYVQYLRGCSECGERECLFNERSSQRKHHQTTNFEKKMKGMENSYSEIMHNLNERFKVKKAELFSKMSAPLEYSHLWEEFLERRRMAREEFEEAMSLMNAARRQMQ
ncbi:hypothetical protein PENTCL1PPCAC_6990 [Pristionchus entomophagus]|uniref:Uncharacterized protein n=1 Tax=Pristionchus entomophagus TaxID=358040 RepID=A0AAV5SP77_9BILA|nr:hypothetical protein PENTCL1PPCAC_6990 [Pristionchus entomophagus]